MAIVFFAGCSSSTPTQGDVEELGDAYEIQGQAHVLLEQEHGVYNSNPPTSGWHTSESIAWGVYEDELPDEPLIHNLEHGGIWISYKDIDDDTLQELTTFAKKHGGSVVVTQRSNNDSKIAIAAWGRLLKMDALDMTVVEAFYDLYKNQSPEKFAGV